jgi:CBS domain-containing protein
MTKDPRTVDAETTLTEAAKLMRDQEIGPVLVLEDGELRGILTDRDIVTRAISEGRDPNQTKAGEICSPSEWTLSPDDEINEATQLLREHKIRRAPVVKDNHPVGIISLGDLARIKDEHSVLAEISAATPN